MAIRINWRKLCWPVLRDVPEKLEMVDLRATGVRIGPKASFMKGSLLTVMLVMATGLVLPALAGNSAFNDSLTLLGAPQRKPALPDRPTSSLAADAVSTIVIDAGHGGHDGGCSGLRHGAREKAIALQIALGLGRRLENERPEIKVIYTRDRDVFVPLHERAAIANRAKADLFISIHCNAMPGGSPAMGSETYVMGLHTAQHNLDVAKRENAAIRLEQNVEQHYDFDPNSPEGHITMAMFQHAFLEQSMSLASYIESELGEREGHPSRGVKQAGFMVLKETAMPSVLIETGYLTNATEEAFLLSEEGRSATIDALFEAVDQYLQDRNTTASTGEVVLTSGSSSVSTTSRPTSTSGKASVSTPAPKAQASAKTSGDASKAQGNIPPKLIAISEPAHVGTSSAAPSVNFYVQLAAAGNPINTDQGKWQQLGAPIRYLREGKMYKYQAGPVSSSDEAAKLLSRARNQGFGDAWLVGYRGDTRLSQQELEAARH